MRSRRNKDDGFTLIEVLAALFVFSSAAIGLMTISQNSVKSVRDLEDRYIARTIADSKMAEIFTDPVQLQLGVIDGEITQMGRPFTWTLTVTESGQQGVYALRVDVMRNSDNLLLAEVFTIKRRGR